MALNFDFLKPEPDPDKERRGAALLLYEIWNAFAQLVWANLLFLLCSLPVVTIPAAWTALTSVSGLIVRREILETKSDFFRAFKVCFGKSLLAALCCWSGPLLCVAVAPFYWSLAQQNRAFFAPLAVVLSFSLFQFMMGIYLFPMLSSVDLPFGDLLRNSARLALGRLPQNLLVLLVLAALAVLSVMLYPISLAWLALCAFSVFAMTATFCAWSVLREHVHP